jgi:hypothetical protein
MGRDLSYNGLRPPDRFFRTPCSCTLEYTHHRETLVAALRMVVGPMPRIAEEILRDAARRRSDLEIIEFVSDWSALLCSVTSGRPDAVMLSDAPSAAGIREVLLDLYPHMTVLVLRGNGREGRAYSVESFGALSADEIFDLVRSGLDASP